MRIIGGKDYYDGAMAMGQDTSRVLVRKRHDLVDHVDPKDHPLGDVGTAPLWFENTVRWSHTGHTMAKILLPDHAYTFEPACVFFAGTRHGGVRVNRENAVGRPYDPSTQETTWYWDHDGFIAFLGSIGAQLVRRNPRNTRRYDAEGIRLHFEAKTTEAQLAWMVENQCSIAIWERIFSVRGWKLNTDGLKEIDFSRRLDAWTAFQELEMFVGGVLPARMEPPPGIASEKVMLGKHGFDERSFRKAPASKHKGSAR